MVHAFVQPKQTALEKEEDHPESWNFIIKSISYLKETKHPLESINFWFIIQALRFVLLVIWVFWQAPSHFWGPLYFFEASSATIEGTSEKLHYSETMMEISCTIFFRRILKIWDPFQDIFSFFLSYLIVQKRFVHWSSIPAILGDRDDNFQRSYKCSLEHCEARPTSRIQRLGGHLS